LRIAADYPGMLLSRRSAPQPTLADDPVIQQLKQRLTSLHDNCLTNLPRVCTRSATAI